MIFCLTQKGEKSVETVSLPIQSDYMSVSSPDANQRTNTKVPNDLRAIKGRLRKILGKKNWGRLAGWRKKAERLLAPIPDPRHYRKVEVWPPPNLGETHDFANGP